MENQENYSEIDTRYYDELIIGTIPKTKKCYTVTPIYEDEKHYSVAPIYEDKKFHIVINKSKTLYTLLDQHLQIVDTISVNPIFNFFGKFYKIKKFKSRINSDFKTYRKRFGTTNIEDYKKLKKLHKDILFYLDLCPDVDCNILELLRRNVTKVDYNYSNYHTSCAEYLHELAKLFDGNPDVLPFDINFATSDNILTSNHKYISNSFLSSSDNAVNDYISIYQNSQSQREQFLEEHRWTDYNPSYTSKYTSQRSIHVEPFENYR